MDLSRFRYPGEFEPQSDVFVIWFPDYCGGEGEDDPRKASAQVIKSLLGHVNVHVNCGCQTSLEACKAYLAAEGVDVTDDATSGQRNVSADGPSEDEFSRTIRFHQFEDWNFYVRDNGPNVMIDGKGNAVHISPRWNNYGMNEKFEPAQQLARQSGIHMAVALECYDTVCSDLVSEAGDREFNGKGVLIAIEDTECRKRNPEYTKEEVEAEYKRIYNLDKVIWLPKPLLEDDDVRLGPIDKLEDGTLVWASSFAAHTDECCRFVGSNTILLAEVTEEEAASNPVDAENKKRLDAAYAVLKDATDAEGQPFTIVRMPVTKHLRCRFSQDDPITQSWKQFFDEAGGKAFDGTPWPTGDFCFLAASSYCNFLICNGVVLGQKYYREGMDLDIKAKDDQAEGILQGLFPDREVVMIDAFGLNLTGGGVHCWTKNVAQK